MIAIDWIVLIGTLLFIVIYGVWKSRGKQDMQSYLRGNNESQWWTIGLSVIATQASAITFMSTPGQAFHDGMGFVQFYFGLPIAMVIICITFIPIYHKLKVYTAYEFLENRFDSKTRCITALLFLVQRGLAAGITIYAPAIILSTILGWDLNILIVIIGLLVVLYTVSGGTKAVNVTQKHQMVIMLGGMTVAFITVLMYLPNETSFSDAITIAKYSNKLEIVDFSFDIKSRYTFWSGITGGLFLALSYFGTDQSQVQRYLSGKSVRESQLGLIMNGFVKVPMQFFILLVGVMVFVFFQFNKAPIHFNQSTIDNVISEGGKDEWQKLERTYDTIFLKKQVVLKEIEASTTKDNTQALQLADFVNQEKKLRQEAGEMILRCNPTLENNDKDYVFISFILQYLPNGIIGLLIAMVFCAAMSSSASELNALATTTTVDIYKRLIHAEKDENHYVFMSKIFTLGWGLIAIAFGCFGSLFENLIQFVNIIGSIFYGTILGIFLIAFYFKKLNAQHVFFPAIISQALVILIYKMDVVGYIWLNAIGCVLVITIAWLAYLFTNTHKHNYG